MKILPMFVAFCGTSLSTFAEIVIKPVRTPSVFTNRLGITARPDGGDCHEQKQYLSCRMATCSKELLCLIPKVPSGGIQP